MDPLPPAPSRWAGRGWGAASFLLPPPGGARSGSQARDPSVRPDSSDGAGVGCCGPHLPTEDARALTGWASVQRKAAPRFPQPPRACSQGSTHCAGVRGSEGVRIRKHGQRGPDSRGACRVGRLAGPWEPRHPLLRPPPRLPCSPGPPSTSLRRGLSVSPRPRGPSVRCPDRPCRPRLESWASHVESPESPGRLGAGQQPTVTHRLPLTQDIHAR